MSVVMRMVSMLPPSWGAAVARARWRNPRLRRLVDWGAAWLKHRDGTIQTGIGRGLRFNAGPANASYVLGTFEPEVQSALADLLRPGMVVFDVGANVGFLAILAARLVGPTGRVVCFEPLPGNARRVEHNAALNGFDNVEVRRLALGAEDRAASFHAPAESTMGRLASAGPAVGTGVEEVVVTLRRLDTVMAAADRPARPDLVKIDVEGAEADVLAGAAATLRDARPVLLIELHDTNVDVARVLATLGYHATALGSLAAVADAAPNAHVVAVPDERADLVAAAGRACR